MNQAVCFLHLKYTAKYTAFLQGDLSRNCSLTPILEHKLSAVRPVFTAFLDYYF